MKMSVLIRGLVCAGAIWLVSPAFGAEAGYAGEKWSFLDTGKVMAAAGQITPQKYPDCDDAMVDKRMVRVYRADGSGECQDESYTKVLTEKGKRGNRSLSLSFMLPYTTVDVVKLEVIKPNGQAEEVDIAANSKEMIDDSQMGMNIYDPNSKILRVNIPKVEIGDVVHSIVRNTIHRSFIPGESAEYNLFEGSGYVRHESYDVYMPSDRPLKRIILRDEIPGTVKYSTKSIEAGGTLHQWEVSEVPRMFDEPSMPAYETVLQRLLVSTTPDWQTVSKWYWGVCQPHLDTITPEMKKSVAELTAEAKTDQERIQSLFYFVSKKIRYMGLTPEKDRPGFEPHDVCLTFGNKYGVCRDKAALLVAMLRVAGFDAYPVLMSVGSKKDKEVPDPFFNHAIVGVDLKKGDYLLMDPTAENTKDLLPSYECDQSILACRPEGDTLRTSPIVPAEENMMRLKTTATLTPAGALEAKSELAFEGINDTEYREAFSHMKADDRRRFFERNLKRSLPGARLKSLKVMPEDVLDVSSGLRAELEFSVEGLTAAGQGKAVVNLPWVGKGLGIVNFILDGTGLEKRKYPLRTSIACGISEELTVKLAEGFSGAVSMPGYAPILDESLGYQRRVEFADGALKCSRELKLKTVEFSPAQYLQLKRTLESMEYDDRKAPVLSVTESSLAKAAVEKSSAAARKVDSNAEILNSYKELAIQDEHSATYTIRYAKRVLTYAGKKREAEVKIPFNPAVEEARLVRAVVTSKTGQRQKISTNEINVMDAGWNASAKRYTGGKLLVANLPGVDIGSTIEVELQIVSKGKPFIAGFESFQLFDDIRQKEVRITAPEGVCLQVATSGAKGLTAVKAGRTNGQQVFIMSVKDVKALPAETQLPPEWTYMPGVSYFVGGMSDYLSAVRKTMAEKSAQGGKAAETARQLAAPAKSQMEAVKAIRDFVAKSIRNAGPSFTELPLSELSAADTTLADGYGHMADRAILLQAMLSAVGLKPEFVLASGLPPVPFIKRALEVQPQAQSFQAVLVRVKVYGETFYLNDTDQYAQLGSTGFDGKYALDLASGKLELVRAAANCSGRTDTAYSLTVDDAGKTRLTTTSLYYGVDFNHKRRYFAELPPEERRRYFQGLVSEVAQGARPVGELVTQFDSYPGREEFTVEIDRYSVVDGKYSYFDLPFTPMLFPGGADERSLPLFIGQQRQYTVRTEINLPPSFRQVDIAPAHQNLSVPGGAGKATVTAREKNGKFVLTHQFETSPAIVTPEQYPAMLKLESTLENKSSKVFLLERSGKK
jgi:hypothetical protein